MQRPPTAVEGTGTKPRSSGPKQWSHTLSLGLKHHFQRFRVKTEEGMMSIQEVLKEGHFGYVLNLWLTCGQINESEQAKQEQITSTN